MKFLSLAALALTFAACSNDDNELTQQQAGQSANGEITITATITKDGTMTRALSLDGIDIASTWTVGEKVAILFDYKSAQTQRDAVVKSVSAGTATVEFTVPADLPGTPTATLVYPSTAVNAAKTGADVATALATQDGIIGNCPEVRTGNGTLDASAGTLTVTTPLAAQNTIFMFTIEDLSSTGFAVSEFKVSDASGNVITTVSPSTAPFWVALPVMAAGTYWFNCNGGGNPYIAKATLSSATTAGKYYQQTLKMATIGDVILSDGKFYAAGTAGAVAKITYVGNDAETSTTFNHGLALAIYDAHYDPGEYWCNQVVGNCMTTRYANYTLAKTDMAGIANTDELINHPSHSHTAAIRARNNKGTAHPTGTSDWFLPSAGQWDKMITTAGSYSNLKTNAGLKEDKSYYSSTEESIGFSYVFDFKNSIVFTAHPEFNRYIRSAVAF